MHSAGARVALARNPAPTATAAAASFQPLFPCRRNNEDDADGSFHALELQVEKEEEEEEEEERVLLISGGTREKDPHSRPALANASCRSDDITQGGVRGAFGG